LALSGLDDLEEIGLPLAAAVAIAAHFGNTDIHTPLEPELELNEPELEPKPVLKSETTPMEPEVSELEQDGKLEPATEPGAPSGPMVEFDEADVLAWLGSVPGLTVAHRVVVAEMMVEDEYDGAVLVGANCKTLGRLLKGSGAEEVVPALLNARDAHLAARWFQ
jgi:hypothetical protein